MRLGLCLLSLLVVSTGCRHGAIPFLPASHGHLLLAMDVVLRDASPRKDSWDVSALLADASVGKPPVELEPEQAPGGFAEAVQLLKGTPSQEEVQRALGDLSAACEAGLQASCAFLHDSLGRPELISGGRFVSPHPRTLVERGMFSLLIFQCRFDTDGRVRDCKVIEGGPVEGTQRVLDELYASLYRPPTLAGHPLSIPYTFHFRFTPPNRALTRENELAWARQRVSQYPQSASAWMALAQWLAVQSPEERSYSQALARAHSLLPGSWWAATEVAWQQVQAGQYAAALITVRPSMRREQANPYVLETAAAAYFGLGQCPEALKVQERAVGLMPNAWPQPEQERFQRKLKDYQTACAAPPAAEAPDVSAGSGPR
ncbi:hypothetical protein OV208_17355 [Corallococcus sp. bb12-1]|uniref:hypothetical protein n=1 Tax=Corallococcus sp. bb12-1 TaxID=2996784 RepID=UPI0022702B62|nr:hypothetical protein [Corallococcus sp. bb12-1]MCY1043092.1 hypothetical protein [Corallococcus sp. bb12-1]